MVEEKGSSELSLSQDLEESKINQNGIPNKNLLLNERNGRNLNFKSSEKSGLSSPMITSNHIIQVRKQRRPHTIETSHDRRSQKQKRIENLRLTRKHSFEDEITYLRKKYINYGSYQRQRGASFGNEREEYLNISFVGKDVHVEFNDKGEQNDKIDYNGQNKKIKSCETESDAFSTSLMYALINLAIVLPVIMSFGNIIYQDPFFRPYLPVLVRLTTISGVVHQIMFSTFSSLPFAVGQVQDAGLIFLSAIASDIVRYCKEEGYDDDHIIATCTIGLSICTAILGISLVILGKLQLVSIVQKLPTSVVGGYLAFIGFFCGQSSLTLMSGIEVDGIQDWYKVFHKEALILIAPGFFGGISTYCFVRNIKHVAVLPICITTLVLFFYIGLAASETTLEEAQIEGWINQADAPPIWYHSWDYMRFEKVVWSSLPSQAFTVISMICVVALSSSLDVAAIELDMGEPLDYNGEIETVGLSNIVSGLTGGYTGSYIFSQTIFSMRSGIRSRTCGYLIALLEFLSVILPFSILSYLPNFFFGSLLIMICVDLMWEWLWDVREKVTTPQFFVAWSTFIFIQIVGVEYGIIGGIILYICMKNLGYDMGEENDDFNDSEESIDTSALKMNSQGGSLMSFYNAFKSQLTLVSSHLSFSSKKDDDYQNDHEIINNDENMETHESLII